VTTCKQSVVVDKSFLQGSSGAHIRELAADRRLLVCDSLFYELLTTSPKVRAACFRKLPAPTADEARFQAIETAEQEIASPGFLRGFIGTLPPNLGVLPDVDSTWYSEPRRIRVTGSNECSRNSQGLISN